MLVKGYRNIPHTNQDTNAAVESYYANLKAILRTSRQKFDSRRVGWLVYNLMKDILVHYWYTIQCKLYEFIKNGKTEALLEITLKSRQNQDTCLGTNRQWVQRKNIYFVAKKQ